MQAVLYARVSTKQQEKHGYRLSTQFADMRKYAAKNGFEVVGEFQEAHTATIPFRDRPEGGKIYQLMQQGRIGAVVVHELDRAARGDTDYEMPIDFLVFWRDLQDAGVELHSCDIGRVEDNILTLIQGWQATKDNQKRRQRSMDGRRDKIKKGHYPGNGPRCYGYDIEGQRKDTHLVIRENEAKVIRLIFRWYAKDGVGVAEICERLTARGIPSYGDKQDVGKRHGAGEWTAGMVYPILRRETYAGVWYAFRHKMVKLPGERKKRRVRRPKSEWVPIAVPAIIDRATWDLTQARLNGGRAMSRRNNSQHEYLMGRRLSCRCGYHVQGKPSWAKGVCYLYYRCNGNFGKLTSNKCDLPGFRATQVDDVIWDWVRDLLSNPDKMAKGWQASQQQAKKEAAPLQQDLEQVVVMLSENESKRERLLDLYLQGSFEIDILETRKAELDKLLADLYRRKAELDAHLAAATITDQQIQEFSTFAKEIKGEIDLANADFETRRGLVERLDLRGILAFENGEKVVHVTCHAGRGRLSVDTGNWL